MAAAAALAEAHQALQWIGFGNQAHLDSICEEAGFESLKDFVGLSEKDIRVMADGYEKRTQAQGRIPFGLRRIKLLIGVMHWVQDQDRCYRNASTGNIADANEFREIIDISIQCAALRKVEDDQVDTISKAADPGKFKDKRKWPDWEPAFMNYLSMIPGSYRVPLSYVVREQEDLDHDRDFGDDFVSEMIACAPLHGAYFRADSRRIHQLLKNYLVAETVEQWIKNLEPHVDGCRDMLALREHYSGEGNTSRHIATAQRMREGLHYKNERSLVFSIFLDCMQKMFNIYEEEGEEFTENSKLRELFKQVQHTQLQDTVKALKVRFDMEGIMYAQAANHLTATVSEVPEYHLTHKVSASSSGTPRIRGGGGNNHNSNIKKKGGMQAPNKGILMSDGSVFTGYYPNWLELSKEDKQCVLDSQSKKNKGGVGNKRQISDVASIAEQLQVMKHTISELMPSKNNHINSESSEDKIKSKAQHSQNNAGNAFGGWRVKSNQE